MNRIILDQQAEKQNLHQIIKIKLMKTIDDWICTDPDNFQYGRKIKDFIYEFKEWNKNAYSLKIITTH